MGKNKKKSKVHIPGSAKPKPFIPKDVKVEEAPHPHEEGKIKDAEIVSEAIEAPISSSGEKGIEGLGFDAWRRAMGYLAPANAGKNDGIDVPRDEFGRILPGYSLNPNGKTPGTLNFKTMFERAVKRLAEINKIDEDMIEVDMVVKAIARARGGDYRYYKDIHDRVYGKPTDKVAMDLTTGGMPIQGGNQITFIDFSGQNNDSESQS